MLNELIGKDKLLKGIDLIRSGNLSFLTAGQINLYKQAATLSDIEIEEYISESEVNNKTPNAKNLISFSKRKYIQKGYKVKLLPTEEQKILLSKHVGAWRFLYNWLYAKRRDVYKNYYAEVFRARSNFFFKNKNTKKKFKPHKVPNWSASYNMIKVAKESKELPEWLNEISSEVINGLCKVFPKKPSGFRKKSKVKKSFANYQGDSIKIKFDNINNKEYIILPIIGKIEHNRSGFIPADKKICSIGISFYNDSWYASIAIREGDKPKLRTEGKTKGVDVGCRKLAVCFDGEKHSLYGLSKNTKEEHADKLIKLNKELAKWQRRVSRRFKKDSKEQSKRYEFAVNKTRSIYKRIADLRNDNLHQVSHRILSDDIKEIVIEDLNVAGMKCGKKTSKRRLRKALIDSSMGKLLTYMEYKSDWRGIKVTKADRYFASSKLCSSCHCKNECLGSEEKWTCSQCGAIHDRDFNASINLYNYEKILPLIKQRENVPEDTGIE